MKSPRVSESVLAVYARYTRPYAWLFVSVIACIIITQGAAIAIPIYLREFINTLAVGNINASPELLSILAVIVGIWFLDWASQRARYYAVLFLELNVMSDLIRGAFSYLLGHSYNFFVSNFAGSLTHKVNRFARAYEVLFDSIIAQFVPTFIFVVGAVVVLFLRNTTLGLVLAVWVVCFIAFQIYVARLRHPVRVARAMADTQVTANLADAVSNQATVALFSGVPHEKARFSQTIARWREATWRSWSTDALIWAGIGLFIIVIQAALLYGGIYYWKLGLFTVGDFVLVQAYLFATFERLETVNRELRRVTEAYSDASEMIEILNMPHGVADKPGAKALAVTDGRIEFRNVDFGFLEERGVFGNFNLDIKGGEKVALIGPSGAGKTTITKLLLRLFDVKDGAIEIDGQNIAEVTQESLRNSIAFVPQEPVLFHRALMENIRYGRRDATDAEVIEAARKAHCDEFISKLPLGYGTYTGERGVKLSGGERQRVAIARAILKNAPILVLDEATSALDSESELLIQDALATLMEGKTVIVIAHRLSTIQRMDRIVALEGGTIAEEGTHQDLLEQKGLYAKLWSHQAGGFLRDEEIKS